MRSIFAIILLSLAVTLSSCSKDNKKETGTISCTIDGVDHTFNTQAMARSIPYPHKISVWGYSGPAADYTSDVILLSVNSDTTIVPGKYGLNFDGPNGSLDFGSLMFTTTENKTHTSVYNSIIPTEITITSLNSSFIEGRFQGDLYEGGLVPNPKKSITNGKFKVPVFQ